MQPQPCRRVPCFSVWAYLKGNAGEAGEDSGEGINKGLRGNAYLDICPGGPYTAGNTTVNHYVIYHSDTEGPGSIRSIGGTGFHCVYDLCGRFCRLCFFPALCKERAKILDPGSIYHYGNLLLTGSNGKFHWDYIYVTDSARYVHRYSFSYTASEAMKEVSKEKKSTAMGFFQAVYAVGMTLFPVITGNVVAKYSMQAGYFVLAGIAFTGSIFVYIFYKVKDKV